MLILCAPVASSATASDLLVYDDALRNGFENWSWGGGSDFANPAPVHRGGASIAFTGNNFNGVSFAQPVGPLDTSQHALLHFWVHGGSAGMQRLRLSLQRDGAIVASAELDSYIQNGAIAANQWREVTVPFAQPPLAFTGAFDRIDLQSDIAGTQPPLYLDDIELRGAPGGDPIFTDGFDDALPPAANALLQERGVNVDGMVSDRFTWFDRSGKPRVAVLAHNNGASGPGGTRGGELREFRYQVGATTRIVRAPPSGAGGFGYVVSHRHEGMDGLAGDDSPFGHGFPGQFERVFEGRHHALFRFTQRYPRWSRTDAALPNKRYDVPVTIEWLFATGRDDPLWAVTWDMSEVPVDALRDDSRAPYGELLFDGSASAGAHGTIAGVAWGDRYKFVSTTAPVSYASAWTWNTPNTIPYVKLWTGAVDATMGAVQTQTIMQHDAGGYFGVARWNTTSAAGNGCTVAIGGVDHRMPCDFNWPFQSINYSLNPFAPTLPTNNTRLAWGSNFGFLGQAAYYVHGSAYYDGPLPNATASGWPRQSYSTYVVLGTHSADPVGAAVAQVEAVQGLTMTASIGSVAASGPAGVGRGDSVVYQPAGYDHVRGALAFAAAANSLDASIAVAAGTLRHPLLVIRQYSGSWPRSVRVDGAVLTADQDYFASLRPGAQELWVTLARDLAVGSHRIQIQP